MSGHGDGIAADAPPCGEAEASAAEILVLQTMEGVCDMLTVVLVSLEQLARAPLEPRSGLRLARADLAAHHARELVWRALDVGPGIEAAPRPAMVLELPL